MAHHEHHEHGKGQRVLLPTHVLPSHYYLHLTPDIDASTFKGTIGIDLHVKKETPSNTVTLHSLNLAIDSASAKLKRFEADGTTISAELAAESLTTNGEEETVTFTFGGQPFKVGEKLSLFVAFSGTIDDPCCGLYHSNYVVNGQTKKGLSTQFEAVDARRCFPCFDEPAMKAVFYITMTVGEHYVALSNMPVSKEEKHDGMKTLHFSASPQMSTYLVCMVVGEYDCVESKTRSGVTMRVWGKKGESHLGQFALDIGTKAMDFYEKFFGIPYPLPKMDMVGLTNMAGAMENWGLVTYRDNALLCDPKTASLRQRMTILTIVTHELGHQWFGNLVTMEWWKELWLNEGFASWVETHCAHEIMPELRPWTDFCRVTLSDGLQLDSLLSSHPIEVEVHRSRDVDEIFDNISYNKGAGVIRMLASIIGIDEFSKGLHKYLSKFSYRNATTLDLWQSLSESTGKDIKSIMHPWTSNMGYPVIYVNTNKEGTVLKFTQHRFLASGRAAPEDDLVLWPIRLAIQTKKTNADGTSTVSDVDFVAFDGREHTIDFETFNLDWFKANVNQSGFMRVIYHHDLFAKLLKGVTAGDFGDIDRWALVCDQFATCLAGLTDVDDLFRLLSTFKSETDNTVLGEISANLGEFDVIFGDQFAKQLTAFRRDLFGGAFDVLGLSPKEGENDHLAAARPIVLAEMAGIGNESVIAECKRLFAIMSASSSASVASGSSGEASAAPGASGGNYEAVSSNLWYMVLSTVAAYGTKEDVETLKRLTTSLKDSMAVTTTIRALGHIKDPSLLLETIEWALLTDTLSSTSAYRILFGASEHQAGRHASWKAFEKNIEHCEKRFHKGPFIFSMMIEHATVFSEAKMADHIAQFFQNRKVVGIDRTIQQCVDKIRGRNTILQNSQASLAAWFKSNGY
jgi:aminopeptidase N